MKATVQMAMSTIRILALHALVKEQQHRVLRQQRHYNLGGAICMLVNEMAKENHSILLGPNCRIVRQVCNAMRQLPEVTDDSLLFVAREWEVLIKLLGNESVKKPLLMTPTFASLMRTVNTALDRKRSAKQARTRTIPAAQQQFLV